MLKSQLKKKNIQKVVYLYIEGIKLYLTVQLSRKGLGRYNFCPQNGDFFKTILVPKIQLIGQILTKLILLGGKEYRMDIYD